MISKTNITKRNHDKRAPFWALAMVVFAVAGLSTVWFNTGRFAESYLLDAAGPAWNYILFRGLFIGKTENRWTHFFTPVKTFVIFSAVCFSIETAQYFQWYASTFDPFDFPAYISLLLPIFCIDFIQSQKDKGKLYSQTSK